jgi:hypothetical protein
MTETEVLDQDLLYCGIFLSILITAKFNNGFAGATTEADINSIE